MAQTNQERVGKGLEFLRDGLVLYVERELKSVHKKDWQEVAKRAIPNERDWKVEDGKVQWEILRLLAVMWDNWNEVFKNTLGHAERSYVSELKSVRNKWAHQEPFSTDDTYRAFDSMHRLLQAISAPEASKIDPLKQELLRVKFDEQARQERRRTVNEATSAQTAPGLKSWREVVMPHPDVASGNYQQAEFAADLDQVHRGEGTAEYREPKDFFQRTFITEGLNLLLKNAMLRLSGKGGDPVVDLQTNFGGGKTHSLLALYHLCSGKPAGELPGLEKVLQDTGLKSIPKAHRVVLVGTALSPGMVRKKNDGIEVRTLWGELAWQIGHAAGNPKAAYDMVAEADAKGVSPGSQVLRELFNRYAPCLILIDEWVAYARMLYQKYDLPAGSFETQFTFAQSLTEAAKAADRTLLLISIPASDIEMGGEGGHEATSRLKNAIGRLESTWRPATAEEGFEIVRRRLFQPIADPQKFIERDAVAKAFSKMYQEQAQEFPSGCGEGKYLERLKQAYPIHPEFFERLYNDWGSLDKFQRTRGVLRLMASVIHELWEQQDGNLLIMPGTLPVYSSRVADELTRYLDDPWRPIIERDVDGPSARPLELDRSTPNLGRYSACRRVARTIYLGSAPTAKTNHPGINEIQIKLGCVQPGESVATFGDALRRLTDEATHLYVDGKRYWYSLQPSVTRVAQDRAAQQDMDRVWEEIKKRLRGIRERGDFTRCHIVPESGADVTDEMEARLVILGPEYSHAPKSQNSEAMKKADEILNHRGTGPRIYRNMLVFLAPDKTRLNDLEQAVWQYLSWKSIERDKEQLNLDAFQSSQASQKTTQANEAIDSRIKETFCWILYPDQPNPKDPITWQEIRLQGQDELAVRASKKLKTQELLITEFSATRLRMELDGKNLWGDGNHISAKKLLEYIASYPYLPRLRDQNVLIRTIENGVSQITWREYFGYAENWDEKNQRYVGLRAGSTGLVYLDENSVIIKPEAVSRQLDKSSTPTGDGGDSPEVSQVQQGISTPGTIPAPAIKKTRRFHGNIVLDSVRVGRDASKIAEEVTQHLSSLKDAKVEITLEIHADMPEGVPENIKRTVEENCRTLKFKNFGFEEE